MASMLPPTRLKADLRQASHMGRTGADGPRDTLLAHINRNEAALLARHGGAATRNPRTGLLEFRVGGSMGAGADGGNSNDRVGHDAGNGGGSGGSHGGSGAYNGQGRPNTVAAAPSGPTGLRGPTDATGQFAGHTTSTLGAGSNFQGGVSDYEKNFTEDPLSRAVKALTGIGLRKPDPDDPSTYANGLAHTGLDPIGVALGVAGMANPIVGIASKLYSAGKLVTGWDGPEVTIGDAKPGVPGSEIHDFSHPQAAAPTGPQIGGGNGATHGGGSLLPPIVGQAAPPTAAVAANGSALPSIAAPALKSSPGRYFSVPGGTPYGVTIPPWLYR